MDGLGKRIDNVDGSYSIEYPSGGKITFDAAGNETGREVGTPTIILHKWNTKGVCEVCGTDVAGSMCPGVSETEKLPQMVKTEVMPDTQTVKTTYSDGSFSLTGAQPQDLTTNLKEFDEWRNQYCEMMECQHKRTDHSQDEFECLIPECVCGYFYRRDEETLVDKKIKEAMDLEDEISALEVLTETDPNNITLVTKLYDKKKQLAKLEGDTPLPELPKNLSGFAALDYMKAKVNAQNTVSSDDLNKPLDTSGVKQTSFGGATWGGSKKFCVHRPKEVITGEGWSVSAGAKWDCKGSARRFPVVMNLMGTSITPQHNIPIPELQKWESKSSVQEMMIDWPDMDVVEFPVEFWTDIRDYLQKEKKKMLIFCVGGHGRTGTAVACLLVVSCNMTADAAISWIRKNYCGEAIENKWQEDYVRDIYQQFRELEKPKKKGKHAKS